MPVTGLAPFFPPSFPPAVVAQVLGLAQAQTTRPAGDQVAPAVEGDGVQGGTPSTVAPGTAAPAANPPPRPTGILAFLSSPFVPLMVVVVFFYVFMISGNRKKEKARKESLNSLVRGDRVTTIGGIIGSVVDAAGDEVTLKIDENNNTKLKITRSAVANVTKPGAEKAT